MEASRVERAARSRRGRSHVPWHGPFAAIAIVAREEAAHRLTFGHRRRRPRLGAAHPEGGERAPLLAVRIIHTVIAGSGSDATGALANT
jgi:hypothetical protein